MQISSENQTTYNIVTTLYVYNNNEKLTMTIAFNIVDIAFNIVDIVNNIVWKQWKTIGKNIKNALDL